MPSVERSVMANTRAQGSRFNNGECDMFVWLLWQLVGWEFRGLGS